MSEPGPSVLVVDDHALLSTTLVIALRGRGVAAHRCEIGTREAVLAAASVLDPCVALVDLDLGTGPDGRPLSGVDLVPVLLAAGWRVVILTGSAAPEADIAAAVTAGAVGWVHKFATFEELLDTVLAAVEGRPVLAEGERMRLVRLHHVGHAQHQARRVGLDQLTARERQVLDELAAGKRAAAIAEDSVVSLATVRAQIRAILTKLGVSSQLEAVALLRELGGD